jgi:hypothetical protein
MREKYEQFHFRLSLGVLFFIVFSFDSSFRSGKPTHIRRQAPQCSANLILISMAVEEQWKKKFPRV